MRYELLLQPHDAATPFDPGRIEELLEQRGAKVAPDGSRQWVLQAGTIEVRTFQDAGAARGKEFKVPLSHQLVLIRETLREVAKLGAEANLRLYDPQLSRTVGEKDEDLVSDKFFQVARYAGEFLGVSEALGASYATPTHEKKSAFPKLAMAIGVIFLLLWLIGNCG